jgi:hypothetical protein
VLWTPFLLQKLDALVNSVKKTSGRAAAAITWRKTTSVTSSIGARIKKGLGKLFQKFVINTF